MSEARKVTRRWNGKVYQGIPGVPVAVDDWKSFTVVVKSRKRSGGGELVRIGKMPTGRRKESSPHS